MSECILPSTKCCTKCGIEKPATLDYFHSSKILKSGLTSRCRDCRNADSEQRRKARRPIKPEPEVIPGMKRCTKCGEYLPESLEFFAKSKRGLHGLKSYCKGCASRYFQEYYAANVEWFRERSRQWGINNPDQKRKIIRQWRVANPQRVREHKQRRAALQRSLPATFTPEQWLKCLEYWHHRCAYCGAQQSFWHIIEQEHYLSMTAGGEYTVLNIIPACKSCNASKGNRPAEEWIPWKFKRRAARIMATIQKYFDWIKCEAD